MSKLFEEWHQLKTRLEEGHGTPHFREGEIWWCSLGANVGVEEDGKNELFERPVIIFRKFNEQMFWGFPMSTKVRQGIYYFSINVNEMDGVVILSQLRTLSGKRLIRRIGKLRDVNFTALSVAFDGFVKKSDPRLGSSGAMRQ